MPVLVVRMLVTLIVVGGLAVTYHGFTGGAWMSGLLWGLFAPAVTLYEWAQLRRSSADAREAVDRMLVAWAGLQLGMALPAIAAIEADLRAMLAG